MKDLALLGLPLTVTFAPTDAEIAAHQSHQSPEAQMSHRTEDLRVRPARIASYNLMSRLLDAQDEVAFTAAAIGREEKWVESLTPESYAALATAVQEVNQTSFFAYYGRRIGRRAATDAVRSQQEGSYRSAVAGK